MRPFPSPTSRRVTHGTGDSCAGTGAVMGAGLCTASSVLPRGNEHAPLGSEGQHQLWLPRLFRTREPLTILWTKGGQCLCSQDTQRRQPPVESHIQERVGSDVAPSEVWVKPDAEGDGGVYRVPWDSDGTRECRSLCSVSARCLPDTPQLHGYRATATY